MDLCDAIKSGHTEVVEVCCELYLEKLDANRQDGRTALHTASLGQALGHLNSPSMIELLLAAKASVNALHLAAISNSVSVAELLLTAGARVNIKAKNGRTPLEIAKSHGGRIAELLEAAE